MIRITKPEELAHYVQATVDGKITFLIVYGKGGLGKTYTIKKALEGRKYLLMSSHLTPASMYELLYHNRDFPVFINDIDKLFNNPTMIGLLKQASETESVKTIQYNSKSPLMADLPREFDTTSPIIIDANNLLTDKNKDFAALLTRGVAIHYEPSNHTLMKELTKYADDEEIVAWLQERVNHITHYDLRKYIIAKQLKEAKLDWVNYLEQELVIDKDMLLVEQIGFTKKYKDRVHAWVEATGLSERTYDRFLKRYRKKNYGEWN